jgi:hypothetical protein
MEEQRIAGLREEVTSTQKVQQIEIYELKENSNKKVNLRVFSNQTY